MDGKTCRGCSGSGMVWGKDGQTPAACPLCDGTGKEWNPGREFTYELGPLTPAGGASLQAQSVQVLNRPFRWMMAVAVSTFPFTAQISDSRDQRPFSNQPVHSSNLWGTAQNPFPLLTPFRFNKNSNILATITDLGGASGFVSVTNGSPTVNWVSGGLFVPGSSWVNQQITIGTVTYTILSVGNQNILTLSINYQGANNANIAYNVGNTIRLGFKGVELDGE